MPENKDELTPSSAGLKSKGNRKTELKSKGHCCSRGEGTACNTGDALGHTGWGEGTMAGDIQGCCQKKEST